MKQKNQGMKIYNSRQFFFWGGGGVGLGHSLIDIFLPAGIDCITYLFTLFNINFAFCHIRKFIVALLS